MKAETRGQFLSPAGFPRPLGTLVHHPHPQVSFLPACLPQCQQQCAWPRVLCLSDSKFQHTSRSVQTNQERFHSSFLLQQEFSPLLPQHTHTDSPSWFSENGIHGPGVEASAQVCLVLSGFIPHFSSNRLQT